MAFKLIQTGQEPGIREAVAWLERHGISKTKIRGVVIDAQVGQPLTITPTILIDDPAELDEASPAGDGSGRPRVPWIPHTDPQGRKCVIPDCDGLHPQGWWQDSAPSVYGNEEINKAHKLEREYEQG